VTTEPVRDPATDYDIFDPDYIKDPFPVWEEIRGKCPVAHTERVGGSWMPTTYEDLKRIAADWHHFSSVDPLVAPIVPPEGHELENAAEEDQPFYGVGAPPISSDPPEHTWTRKLLLPPFSQKSIEKWEPFTREHCNKLIDGFIENGRCDGAVDYAQQIPPYVIATMMGIPNENTDMFTQWVREFLEFGLQNFDSAVNSRTAILTFLWSQIEARKQDPKDDLITYLVQSEVDGAPPPDTHILGTCFLLLVAGIDTTWSSIGSALWHLAQNPQHRKMMLEDEKIFDRGIEELLRAYAPVTMARLVTQDVQYDGCQMKQGDKILMNFPAGNRDPAKFENPDEVIIDRALNPHIAFGVGIHRCAGSNLARMEMRVAIGEFLKRIPDFHLEAPDAVTWAGGQVRGPRTMGLVFD